MRRALIIGSEFGAAADPPSGQGADEQLDFVPDVAEQLTSALAGSWTIHDGATLLNPTAETARRTIRAAIDEAARDRQPLLLGFLGHGVVIDNPYQPPDFYLQYQGSSHQPDSAASLHLVQFLKEVLSGKAAERLNGLVLLVDACSAGGVPINAALEIIGPVIGNRLEVLVASDAGKAFNCCFSRTLTDTLKQGISRAGETIHPANVYPAIATACITQSPAHMSYTNGYRNLGGSSDPALWLVPNRTRSWHALLDRPDAGILDQVTEGVHLSTAQKKAIQSLKDAVHQRLRIVTGAAGAGKTTILSTLVNPQQDRHGQLTASNISAAVFLNRTSTPETIITELADQLASSSRARQADSDGAGSIVDFYTARRQVAEDIKAGIIPGATSLLHRELILPLTRSLDPAEDTVQVVVDGLDQANPSHASAFHELIHTLTTDARLERLRMIVGIRQTDQPIPDTLAGSQLGQVQISPPLWDDLPPGDRPPWFDDVIGHHCGQPIPSGWLTIRLLEQMTDDPGQYDLAHIARTYYDERRARLRDQEQRAVLDDAIELLCVTGIGPVLPVAVLRQALNELGHKADETDMGAILATLGTLILRGRAGYHDEHVGFAHLEIVTALSGEQP